MLLCMGDVGVFLVIMKVFVKLFGLGMSKFMLIGYFFLDIFE